MRACFAIVALALLAVAQGCGESVRPVETPAASSVFVAPVVPTATHSAYGGAGLARRLLTY